MTANLYAKITSPTLAALGFIIDFWMVLFKNVLVWCFLTFESTIIFSFSLAWLQGYDGSFNFDNIGTGKLIFF